MCRGNPFFGIGHIQMNHYLHDMSVTLCLRDSGLKYKFWRQVMIRFAPL